MHTTSNLPRQTSPVTDYRQGIPAGSSASPATSATGLGTAPDQTPAHASARYARYDVSVKEGRESLEWGYLTAEEADRLVSRLRQCGSQYRDIRVVGVESTRIVETSAADRIVAEHGYRMVLVRDVRRLGVSDADLIAGQRAGVLALHEHGSVGCLSDSQRAELIRIGETWYNAVTVRR